MYIGLFECVCDARTHWNNFISWYYMKFITMHATDNMYVFQTMHAGGGGVGNQPLVVCSSLAP